jgi:hypothetical protein
VNILKKTDYDTHIKKLRLKSLHLYTKWANESNPATRTNKPRDPEEDLILFLLDYQRWQKALDTGYIEKTGARRYRWNG